MENFWSFLFSKWRSICLTDVKSFTMMLSFSATLNLFSSMPLLDDCSSSMLLNSLCFSGENKHHDKHWHHQLRWNWNIFALDLLMFELVLHLRGSLTTWMSLNKRVSILIWNFSRFTIIKQRVVKHMLTVSMSSNLLTLKKAYIHPYSSLIKGGY